MLLFFFLNLFLSSHFNFKKNYLNKIGCWQVGFYFWEVFVFRVMYICSKRFLTILMGNNKIRSENNVWMVWVQKEVIMCWFVIFASFRAK